MPDYYFHKIVAWAEKICFQMNFRRCSEGITYKTTVKLQIQIERYCKNHGHDINKVQGKNVAISCNV